MDYTLPSISLPLSLSTMSITSIPTSPDKEENSYSRGTLSLCTGILPSLRAADLISSYDVYFLPSLRATEIVSVLPLISYSYNLICVMPSSSLAEGLRYMIDTYLQFSGQHFLPSLRAIHFFPR